MMRYLTLASWRLLLLLLLCVGLLSCGKSGSESTGPTARTSDSFVSQSCVIDEVARLAAHRYYASLLFSTTGCAAIDRVLPECRATWNQADQLNAVLALGYKRDRAPSIRSVLVGDHSDTSAAVSLIGPKGSGQIDSTWRFDDRSGIWMIDSCNSKGSG